MLYLHACVVKHILVAKVLMRHEMCESDRLYPCWKLNPVLDYMADASQRWVLFFDAMRQRGNSYQNTGQSCATRPELLSGTNC